MKLIHVPKMLYTSDPDILKRLDNSNFIVYVGYIYFVQHGICMLLWTSCLTELHTFICSKSEILFSFRYNYSLVVVCVCVCVCATRFSSVYLRASLIIHKHLFAEDSAVSHVLWV